MKLRSKLLIGGLSSTMIPILIIGLISVYRSSESVSSIVEHNLSNVSENIAGHIESGLANELRLVETISFFGSVISVTEEAAGDGGRESRDRIDRVQDELGKIKERAGSRYSSILLLNGNGIVIADSSGGKFKGLDLHDRDYFLAALQGKANIGTVVESRATGKVILTAAAPIRSSRDNAVVGAVVSGIFVEYLTELADRTRLGKGGYSFVIDTNGRYIAHPLKEYVFDINIAETLGMESLVAHLRRGRQGMVEYSRNGFENIASVTPIAGSEWYVVAVILKAELLAPASRVAKDIAFVACITAALGACFFCFFAKSVVDPLEKLQEGARIIGNGDLDFAFQIQTHSELDALAKAFNEMAQKLKTTLQKVKSESEERKAAEEQVVRANAELSRSNEDLQQFAYVASHDLQEPLRSVVGYLQFIERLYADKLDDKGKDFIDRAVAATKRMQSMIQDLLTFSQVATRGKPFMRCNPAEILADTLESLNFSIESKAASVTVGKLPEVVADRSQLKQLFQNLIGNALKFCDKERPAIDIFCNEHDGKAVFMVRDNGIGIEPEYREKIFEIFQRLHGRSLYEGTGIGLAVCKKIVERHRGKIWVESVPGEGSTFCFTLGDAMEYSRQDKDRLIRENRSIPMRGKTMTEGESHDGRYASC